MTIPVSELRPVYREFGQHWDKYKRAVRTGILDVEDKAFGILNPYTLVVLYHYREQRIADRFQVFQGTQQVPWAQARNLGSKVKYNRPGSGKSFLMPGQLVMLTDEETIVCDEIQPEFIFSTGTSHMYICNPQRPVVVKTTPDIIKRVRLEDALKQEYVHHRSVGKIPRQGFTQALPTGQ